MTTELRKQGGLFRPPPGVDVKGANVTGYSAIGQREENEDAYAWTGEGEPRLFLLADGMGGAAAGEVASRTAVEAAQARFAERMSQAGRDPGPCLVDAIWLGADCLVKVASRAAPWLRGMGSTLVAITLLPLGTHSPGRVPCDGSGECECECGHSHECRACEGTGKDETVVLESCVACGGVGEVAVAPHSADAWTILALRRGST